jgi:sorbitol-6-phosphate 2-dehydrogenase
MRLAQEGAHVVVADLNEETAKTAAHEIMSGTDRKALAIRVDVTDEAQVEGMVARAVQEFGRLDVVVSNAGILIAEEVAEFPADKWRAVINVNLVGYFLVAKHAAKVMKAQRKGIIIQINSKSGKKGSYKNSAYAASKFGGIGLTQSIALDWQSMACVNAVCPNLLDSPLWTRPQLAVQQYANKVGHQRTGASKVH